MPVVSKAVTLEYALGHRCELRRSARGSGVFTLALTTSLGWGGHLIFLSYSPQLQNANDACVTGEG